MRTERQRTANLAVLLVILAGVTALLQGPAFWLGQLVVVAATAFGAFQYLADLDPRGVPIESLAMPMVATFATAGLAHLIGPGPVYAAILAGGGVLIAVTLLVEAPRCRRPSTSGACSCWPSSMARSPSCWAIG